VILNKLGRPLRYTIPEGYALLDANDALEKRYQVKDHLGTPRVTFANNGVLGARDNYPYGQILPDRDLSSETEDIRYQFTGHEHDGGHSKLDYHGARYFDRELGRYLSVDPLKGERSWLSPYNYVQNNPVLRIDPTGALDWKPDSEGNLIAEANDDALSLSEHLEIEYDEAAAIFNDINNWESGSSTDGIKDVEGKTLTISDTRQRIANTADYHIGKTDWNQDVARGDFPEGSNKCNVFCYEVTRQAGADPGTPNVINPTAQKYLSWFIDPIYGPPFAGQWADPNYQIPGWYVLGPGNIPQRGDVVSFGRPDWTTSTGHVAIVTGTSKDPHVYGLTTGTSSTVNKIAKTNFGFDPALSSTAPYVFRRYIGH